jgi:signal transduction histidine kinase
MLPDAQTKRELYYNTIIKHTRANNFFFWGKEITERKEFEKTLTKNKEDLEKEVKERTKALEDALAVKSRFLATMSHEIRTPLSGVIGMLNLLSEVLADAAHQEMIRIASVCGEQLVRQNISKR